MIKLEKVSKIYENGTKAVDNVSFELPQAGMVAITGTSGSGKSTLLNLLSNNDSVTQGQITYDGTSYADLGTDALLQDFAYIYQDFKLIDNLTVYQNIMIGHELSAAKIDYDYVMSIAQDLGISELADEKVYSLSGGQMQRVAIARALARRPKVIFADEPTGNLDSENSVNVYNILRKLAQQILVVVVSHDESIVTWADRVISLADGKIVADEVGMSTQFVECVSKEAEAEEQDIEEILRLQRAVRTRKTSKFFSHKNIPKADRKSRGLSGRSSLGLSVALINKDIVKKVFLTIVMVILIAFMTLSGAMTFATVEKTMAKAINKLEGQKTFAVQPVVDNAEYQISAEDMQKFDSIIAKSGLECYQIASGEVIADGFGDMYPVDDTKMTAYFALMNAERIQNAVFTDNVQDIGVEMLLGSAPKSNNEIAISRTFYEYLLHFADFEVERNAVRHTITFSENNVLQNRDIERIFGVVISGVFDDKNGLDSALKGQKISQLTDEQLTQLETTINNEYKSNPFINMIIKCGAAAEDWGKFAGVNTMQKMTFEDCYGTQNSEYCFDFAPKSSVVTQYFGVSGDIAAMSLADNEIIVDTATLRAMNEFIAKYHSDMPALSEGDMVPLCSVKMRKVVNMIFRDGEPLAKQNLTIAKVVDSIGSARKTILVNEHTFNNLNVIKNYTERRLISAKHVSAANLAMLNKEYDKYMQSKGISGNKYVRYGIPSYPITQSNDYGFVFICQQYICVPLIIATILMSVGIIVVFYFDFVKTKAKDLLILKSLGVKTTDLLKVYGIFCVALVILQMLFGLLLGNLLIWLINIFASKISGYSAVFSVFYLDAASWILTICLVLVVNAISLAISLAGINNKNLRKAFQKLKK